MANTWISPYDVPSYTSYLDAFDKVFSPAQKPPPVGGSTPTVGKTQKEVNPSLNPPLNTNDVNNIKGGENTNNDNYSFSYPTSSDGKYFTATQALIYIGNLYIDEVVDLQFTYQGNKIPIYGYSSTNLDAFGQGKRLVQGQFSVNLVTEGYLYVVLDQYRQKMSKTSLTTTVEKNITSLSNAIGNARSENQTVGSFSQQGSTNLDQQISLNAIDQLAASLGPNGITAAKGKLNQDNSYKNAITLPVPFNIVINFTGGGRTVTRTLYDCVLISNDLQLDQSGSTLVDSYGFLAREAK